MLRVLIAVDRPHAGRLASELGREGIAVVGTRDPEALAAGGVGDVAADVLVLRAGHDTLTRALVAECDDRGIRIVPLCDDDPGRRRAARLGLVAPLPADVEGWVLAEALAAPALSRVAALDGGGRVVAVWGPHGSPGRSTLAIELAAELSRGAARVALADADAHAPSLALALGLADEGPGLAAACRQADRGGPTAAELERIALPVSAGAGTIDVLTGINRPGRWPELSASRVVAALEACRGWADHVVVDVAASLERDEEIVSDLDAGPRRNAATLAALGCADLVVAVCAADPVGVARFLRAHAELRATVGSTPVIVVVNRLRAATMGVDARGQVRRTLERFAGIERVWFVPLDPRSADAALLAARPVAEVAPRSPLSTAVRRLVAEAIPAPSRTPAPPHPQGRRAARQERRPA